MNKVFSVLVAVIFAGVFQSCGHGDESNEATRSEESVVARIQESYESGQISMLESLLVNPSDIEMLSEFMKINEAGRHLVTQCYFEDAPEDALPIVKFITVEHQGPTGFEGKTAKGRFSLPLVEVDSEYRIVGPEG